MNQVSVTTPTANNTPLAIAGTSGRPWIEPGFPTGMQRTLVPPLAYQGFGLEAYGESSPKDEVGGDLLDLVARGSEIISYVADVSGHGLRAGVLMAMIKTAVRYGLLLGQPLTKLLGDLNRVLPPLKEPDMFVTFAMLRFDGSGEAEYISAGHVPLLQYRCSHGDVVRHCTPQLPLGMFVETEYYSQHVHYEAGDVFVLVSDGVVELADEGNEEFGFRRLEQLLAESRDFRLTELVQAIYAELQVHGIQQDDQTVLVLRASGQGIKPRDDVQFCNLNKTADRAESRESEWEKLLDELAADLMQD